MLNLQFAPSSDLLLPLLVNRFRSAWKEKDPFQPPTIIVPSPAVGTWLRMQLAREKDGNGRAFHCIANLELPTLERYLWRALKPDDGMRLLDVNHLQQVIGALLDKELTGGPAGRTRYACASSGS